MRGVLRRCKEIEKAYICGNRASRTHLGERDGQTHDCEGPIEAAAGQRKVCVEGTHVELRYLEKWKEGEVAALVLILVLYCKGGGGMCALKGHEVGEAEVKCCLGRGGKGHRMWCACAMVCWRLCVLGGSAQGQVFLCVVVC